MEPKVSRRIYNKRIFDVNSAEDLKIALNFLQTGQWEDYCPFAVDWPYTTVPDMIKTEVVLKYLPKIVAENSSKKRTKKRA